MPLFVAQHIHRSEACTAEGWVRRLYVRVSASGAAYYGVAIQAEAVVAETHTLLLIVEAADIGRVERYMATFTQWGPVAVYAASPAEEVATRSGCQVVPSP